jgi:hypothetical protein
MQNPLKSPNNLLCPHPATGLLIRIWMQTFLAGFGSNFSSGWGLDPVQDLDLDPTIYNC